MDFTEPNYDAYSDLSFLFALPEYPVQEVGVSPILTPTSDHYPSFDETSNESAEVVFQPNLQDFPTLEMPNFEEPKRKPGPNALDSKLKKQKTAQSEEEEKYLRRLAANKKSAQASRERKKALKSHLEERVKQLSDENTHLSSEITELETENKVLKNEFVHLQKMITDSPVFSKLLARANMTMPTVDLSYYNQNANLPRDTLTNSNNAAVSLFLMFMMNSFSQFMPDYSTHVVTPMDMPQTMIVAPAN